MRFRSILMAAASKGRGGPAATDELLLVAGQSNALSSGTTTVPAAIAGIDSSRVRIWNGSAFVGYVAGTTSQNGGAGKWGPEAEYARQWLAANPAETLYIVKRPVGATAIETWMPSTGTNYTNMSSWVTAGLAAMATAGASGYSTNLIWVQGESDETSPADARAYEAQLTTFIAGTKSDWGVQKAVVVRVDITGSANRLILRKGQNNVCFLDPVSCLVDTDDMAAPDNVHYDNDGIVLMGSRAYASITTGATIEYVNTEPYAFTFTDVASATVSTQYTSGTITVEGITAPATLTITGGTYSINGGAYASASTTVVNGDTVAVRVTSSASGATAVDAVLTIGGVSDTYTVTTAGVDSTAPTLSSPSDAANGSTAGTLAVTTDEGNGTLYWFVSTSGTPPSAANLKTGTGAVSYGNQAVTGTGVQNVAATGLTASTAYYAHFLHTDAAANDSAIATGDGFTTTAAGPAYESWTGPGWFDFSDTGTLTLSGSNITAMTNKRSGSGDLTYGGTAAKLTTVAAAQNGLAVGRLVRDVSSVSAVPRLKASSTATISTMFQGNDKPYTVIAVYKPTDTNTGIPWSASDRTASTSDSEAIALIRRSGTASSVRRQLVTATSNDVSWGSGQASGSWIIVAVKHSGTAVTVWDNTIGSKALDASAQDVATFSSDLSFALLAAETTAVSDPAYIMAQCNMDIGEVVVENSAMADGDVTQAMTDLATKWGITLA